MASAYATFAADGERHPPYIVAEGGRRRRPGAVRPHGDERRPGHPGDVRSRWPATSPSRCSAWPPAPNIGLADGRTVAVKTGTVQLPGTRDQNKDAWTVGYTPSISTAVWVGSDDSDPIRDAAGKPIFGRMVPGSIWQEFMSNALRGTRPSSSRPSRRSAPPPSADERGRRRRLRPRLGRRRTTKDRATTSDKDDEDKKDKDDKKNDDNDNRDGNAGRRRIDSRRRRWRPGRPTWPGGGRPG